MLTSVNKGYTPTAQETVQIYYQYRYAVALLRCVILENQLHSLQYPLLSSQPILTQFIHSFLHLNHSSHPSRICAPPDMNHGHESWLQFWSHCAETHTRKWTDHSGIEGASQSDNLQMWEKEAQQSVVLLNYGHALVAEYYLTPIRSPEKENATMQIKILPIHYSSGCQTMWWLYGRQLTLASMGKL